MLSSVTCIDYIKTNKLIELQTLTIMGPTVRTFWDAFDAMRQQPKHGINWHMDNGLAALAFSCFGVTFVCFACLFVNKRRMPSNALCTRTILRQMKRAARRSSRPNVICSLTICGIGSISPPAVKNAPSMLCSIRRQQPSTSTCHN